MRQKYYSISQEICTRFLLCCVLLWLYIDWFSHIHQAYLTIAPVPAKQPWWIWINASCEFIMNDCITTTKQSTTKPCAYFLVYTVHLGFRNDKHVTAEWWTRTSVIPLNIWRNNNVAITPKRHFYVIESKWRHFDAITTSLLNDVSAGMYDRNIHPSILIPDELIQKLQAVVTCGSDWPQLSKKID